MKQKRIQLIINIITIINIVVISILLRNIVINNKYSQKYVKELLEKNNNYTNYILEIEETSLEDSTTTLIKKIRKEDAAKVEYINENSTRWYTKDMVISEERETNTKVYANQEQYLSSLGEELKCFELTGAIENYKYIKKEKYNKRECIVVEFGRLYGTMNEGEKEYYSRRIWVDIENGFILKEEHYCEEELSKIILYKIQVNIVTDKEIDLPDLTEYELLT